MFLTGGPEARMRVERETAAEMLDLNLRWARARTARQRIARGELCVEWSSSRFVLLSGVHTMSSSLVPRCRTAHLQQSAEVHFRCIVTRRPILSVPVFVFFHGIFSDNTLLSTSLQLTDQVCLLLGVVAGGGAEDILLLWWFCCCPEAGSSGRLLAAYASSKVRFCAGCRFYSVGDIVLT